MAALQGHAALLVRLKAHDARLLPPLPPLCRWLRCRVACWLRIGSPTRPAPRSVQACCMKGACTG